MASHSHSSCFIMAPYPTSTFWELQMQKIYFHYGANISRSNIFQASTARQAWKNEEQLHLAQLQIFSFYM